MPRVSARYTITGLALAVALGGGGALCPVRPAQAQAATHCYLVACTGNVCVWQEIPCPKEKQ
jgi:hypothetical protein